MSINLEDIEKGAEIASQVVAALAPFATLAFPGAATAIATGVKIAAAAQSGLPAAVDLVAQVTGGTPLTPDQYAANEASYEKDEAKLQADIAAELAKP